MGGESSVLKLDREGRREGKVVDGEIPLAWKASKQQEQRIEKSALAHGQKTPQAPRLTLPAP